MEDDNGDIKDITEEDENQANRAKASASENVAAGANVESADGKRPESNEPVLYETAGK